MLHEAMMILADPALYPVHGFFALATLTAALLAISCRLR